LLADSKNIEGDILVKVVKHSAVIYFVVTALLLSGISYGDNNTAKAQTPNQEEQKEKQDISNVQEENELEDKNDEDDKNKDDIPLEFEVPIPFP
jgi:mannitol-specific phosphotransferase system IIBC component